MCGAVCDRGGALSPLFSFPFYKRAVLKVGITDEGLRVLASAGCGEKLTSLTLQCRCCCVQFDGVLEWEVERACRMCDAG